MSKISNIMFVGMILIGAIWFFGAQDSDKSRLFGKPRIVDGDTVAFGDRVVRITGIDAPEFDQVCRSASGQVWLCGARATQFLVLLSVNNEWSCEPAGTDKYRRILARCWVSSSQTEGAGTKLDVASELVAAGLAFSASAYAPEQALAKAAKMGMHAGDYIRPSDWRNGVRFEDTKGPDDNLLLLIWKSIINWF